ncbi:hypothetical protein V8F33_011446 [Rhypophila sp. PSN 637]
MTFERGEGKPNPVAKGQRQIIIFGRLFLYGVWPMGEFQITKVNGSERATCCLDEFSSPRSLILACFVHLLVLMFSCLLCAWLSAFAYLSISCSVCTVTPELCCIVVAGMLLGVGVISCLTTKQTVRLVEFLTGHLGNGCNRRTIVEAARC